MRKISEDLMDRLLKGNLNQLLSYILTDSDLRLEVKPNGKVFIYYRALKVIELSLRNVDNNHGILPSPEIASSDPAGFFRESKKSIDDWIEANEQSRSGFDSRQFIAQANQSIKERFFILDMEYSFEQHEIKSEERHKSVTYDLLGIDQERNTIVLFEIQKGKEDHFQDFKTFIQGENMAIFRKNLIQDVDNILKDKTKIGLIDDIILSEEMEKNTPDFVLIVESDSDSDDKDEVLTSSSQYETIILDEFILK